MQMPNKYAFVTVASFVAYLVVVLTGAWLHKNPTIVNFVGVGSVAVGVVIMAIMQHRDAKRHKRMEDKHEQ